VTFSQILEERNVVHVREEGLEIRLSQTPVSDVLRPRDQLLATSVLLELAQFVRVVVANCGPVDDDQVVRCTETDGVESVIR